MDAPDSLARFVSLSAALTGYDRASLEGTGMVEAYWDTLNRAVGGPMVGRLLAAWDEVAPRDDGGNPGVEARLRAGLLGDPDVGPIARNLVVLWYLGQWNQMPGDWRGRNGASAGDRTRVVSAEAYREGLVWEAIGAHPMGAKQQGFGAWALRPRGVQGRDG